MFSLRIRKPFLHLALSALALIMITACGGGDVENTETSGTSATKATGKLRIAVIPKGTAHLFWQSVHTGALKAAKELGVEIVWNGPQTETQKEQQIAIVENFITSGVDGIVLAPQDQNALVGVVNRAADSNIPVVIFDSGINTENYVSFVATDNFLGGVKAAEEMGRILQGHGTIIVTKVDPGSDSTAQREKGFEETIKDKFPGLQIIAAQYGYSDNEKSRQVTEDMLSAHPEVNAVYGPNESSTFGALLALRARNLAGEKVFVGFDSSPEFIKALANNEINALIVQNPVNMGYQAVKAVVAHINGETVERRIDTGSYIITPENMNEPENKELLSPDLSILRGE